TLGPRNTVVGLPTDRRNRATKVWRLMPPPRFDAQPDGSEAGDGEPRRRRRRGRRGGRRRRGRSSTGESVAPNDSSPPSEGTVEKHHTRESEDDEPLRAGYMGEVARGGNDAPRRGDAQPNGERGQRRQRGRSGRGSRSGPTSSDSSAPSESSSRNQGRRRGSGRHGSRSDQGRRGRGGDFQPVAGSLHEDDEGLELLSVDDAGASGHERATSAAEDDVFVESGLADVLDVPSWVEAIGIVIAGNLEARSRPPRPENRGR
ncbi:MAG: hypothetical protein ACKOCN_08095, partial [Planctomycetaceae bacterium]